ncbi:glycosyltransferase [Oceanomicrobium pacificus]|uniref:Glycosyltransferase n=1 Tax=Oceanomicrobium pacificus TaxID=2692916 RepID=A0A6B0TTU7_9RHOB|nr:glycosyltransferase [Oceanomicrobium pacificus]MXU64662.1 glycosyltransferase [Oceanomicrobium pacificus]
MSDAKRPRPVCLLAPVAPYRSGIARHSTALARELAARADVDLSVFSFSKQYPPLLFPGASDTLADVRTYASPLGTRYSLNSVSPLSWRRTAAEISAKRPELLVLPAWTFFVAPGLGYVARSLRRRGTRIATIVHNAEDHETSRWKAGVSRFQLSQSSYFLTHNSNLFKALHSQFPDVPARVSPHPLYDDYPEAKGRLARRGSVELLFFGIVRPYKGLDLLLEAMARAENRDIHLSIVGEFWSGREETEALIARLGIADRVELVARYVSDKEAAEYFHRCDAVVTPYRSASASGVHALAQHYRRPIISSDIPGLNDRVRHGHTGWLFDNGDVPMLTQILDKEVTAETARALRPNIAADADHYSWSRFADTLLA